MSRLGQDGRDKSRPYNPRADVQECDGDGYLYPEGHG